MALFGKLFAPKQHPKMQFIEAMVEMADEGGRTHEGFVSIYTRETKDGRLPSAQNTFNGLPSGRGLFKARYLGSMYMVMAFGKATRDEEGMLEMLKIASGVAMRGLEGEGSVSIDRDEARAITGTYSTPSLAAIGAAIDQAPLLPGVSSAGLEAVAGQMHDSISESISPTEYSNVVRERFDTLVMSNCAMSINHAAKWARGK